MRTNYVLIDFENVHVKSLDLIKDEHFRVIVFLGPKNTKLPVELVLAMQQFGTRGEYVVLETPGTNALDFHMAFHLGQLAAEDPSGFFHIISKDTGFDPLIQHLKARKIFSARSPCVEEMPCFRSAASFAATMDASRSERGNLNTERFDELCSQAIAQLIAMKKAKPAKLSTLHSTIQAKLGNDVPASTVDMVCSELVKRGLVKANGERVLYAMEG